MNETINLSSPRRRSKGVLIYPILAIFFFMFAANAYSAALDLNYTTIDMKKDDENLRLLADKTSVYFKNLTLCDTGYNRKGGGAKGSYYYTILGEDLLLFLISEEEAEGKKELKNFSLRARLIRDDETTSLLTEKMAEDLSWSCKELRGMSLPYVASGPDANYFKNVLTLVFSGAGLFTAFICFVSSILGRKNRKRSKTAGLR